MKNELPTTRTSEKDQWSKYKQAPQITAKPGLSRNKLMLCVSCDWKGIIHYELLLPSKTIKSDLYCQHLMRLKEEVEKKRPEPINREGFSHDNARPHTFLATQQILRSNSNAFAGAPADPPVAETPRARGRSAHATRALIKPPDFVCRPYRINYRVQQCTRPPRAGRYSRLYALDDGAPSRLIVAPTYFQLVIKNYEAQIIRTVRRANCARVEGTRAFHFLCLSLSLLGGLTMPEWKGRVPLTRSHCERIT
ncbi:Mariner Mos1 transposase [Eumeta japonica]|uniref:Mariner Mos1 transposase n=1 Tax=Eumeta variegata TaxID=151549 RepID=A0A4C1VAL2_EUMVA|nr:Mariner Mos1 transposase [Eumeta japonica]